MANPIKASDLYQDDGAIQAAIEQLKSLKSTYEALLESTRKDAVRLEVEVKKIASTTENYAESLQKAAARADELDKQHREFSQAAKGVEDAIKKTEKSQQEQNETIAESVELTEEMEKALAKYAEALDDNKIKTEAIRLATTKMNQINKLEAKLAMSRAGSYNALSAQYSILKIKLNDMTAAERASTQAGQAMEKQAAELYEEMKRLQEVTGKHTLNVGNYTESVKKALAESDLFANNIPGYSAVMRAYSSAVDGLAQAKIALSRAIAANLSPLKLFRIALISTGIGAIVVILGSLVAAFFSTQRGIDALNRVLVPLKTVFQGLLGLLQELSFKAFDRFKAAVQDPIGAIKSLGNSIKEFLIDRIEGFARYGVAFAKILKGDFKEGFEELGKAAGQATGLDALGRAIGGATEAVKENVKANFELGKRIIANRIALREEEIAWEARREALEREIAINREIAANREKDTAQRLAASQKAIALVNQVSAAEVKLAKMRLTQAQLEAQANDTDAEGRLEIARLQGEVVKAERAAIDRRRELVTQGVEIRAQAAAAEAAILKAQQAEEARIAAERQKTLDDLAKFEAGVIQGRAKTIAERQAVELSKLDDVYEEQRVKLEQFGLSTVKLENLIESEKARVRAQFAKERMDAAIAEADRLYAADLERFNQQQELERSRLALVEMSAEERADTELELERAKLKKLLELNQQYAGNLTDLQIQTIENQIKAIENQIKAIDEKLNQRDGRTIAELLGVTEREMGVINDAFSFAKAQLDEFMQKRVEAANQAVQRSDNEVQAAQAALQAELEAANLGYASNVERAKKELRLAQDNQKKALEQQRQAQRAQQQIQAATQAANLVTASSKILADFKLPFALLALAVMWGAFATAQVKAGQLTKKQYAKGGFEFLDYGGSHASGNDNPLGMTRDGRQRTAERGEAFAVFNRRATSAYRDVLPGLVDAINRGRLERAMPGAEGINFSPVVMSADMRRTERELEQIRRQGERKIYTDAQGRTVEVFRNRKTIYHA
jgi:hypothetical protein